MGEFLGKILVVEVMVELYGKEIRIITAIGGTVGAVGEIAVQLKAFANVAYYFTAISSIKAIIYTGVLLTTYSTLGSVRSVTRTGILQFFTFGFCFAHYRYNNVEPNVL